MAKIGEATRPSKKAASSKGDGHGSESETQDLFKLWTQGYSAVSDMWQQSYHRIYDPWIQSAGTLFDKAAELSKENSPNGYKEFFEELLKTQQNTMSSIYPSSKTFVDREVLEKLAKGANESAKLMKSWSDELEANSKKTKDMLVSGAGRENYKEFYDMWADSFEKIFDGFLKMMTSDNTRQMFEAQLGVPSAYLSSVAEAARVWKETWRNIYTPWSESTFKLYGKFLELTEKGAPPEAYREFYDQWVEVYRETFSKMISTDFARPSKEAMENMLKSVNTGLDMYRSWLDALQKIADKMKTVSANGTPNTETFAEIYSLWFKAYGKAYEDFMEFVPVYGPLNEIMGPMRSMAKVQMDMFSNSIKMWLQATGKGQKAE